MHAVHATPGPSRATAGPIRRMQELIRTASRLWRSAFLNQTRSMHAMGGPVSHVRAMFDLCTSYAPMSARSHCNRPYRPIIRRLSVICLYFQPLFVVPLKKQDTFGRKVYLLHLRGENCNPVSRHMRTLEKLRR